MLPPLPSMTSGAEKEIRARIAQHGRITFAEFMGIALYHPDGGYYTRGGAVGAEGDFYTSPSAHPAFGALLAIQLQCMWKVLGRPARFDVVELGAGNGRLATDVTTHAASLEPRFAEAVRYVAVDRSLPGPGAEHVGDSDMPRSYDRVQSDGVPMTGVEGCLISNELVDAFPVHRFLVDDDILELYVTERDGKLVEIPAEPSTPKLVGRLDRLPHSLPPGYCGEVNLAIGPWMMDVGDALERGFVVTTDYGGIDTDLYSAKRMSGTLQTYRGHSPGAGPLTQIGLQDITSHADFSSIAYEGRRAGLETIGFVTQAEYLGRLGLGSWVRAIRTMPLGQNEMQANAMAMRNLVDPSGLGNFKVLVQEKGTGIDDMNAIMPDLGEGDLGDPPLLSREHMRLMEGRYAHTTWQPTWEDPAGDRAD